jgi:hypothetical protein
MMARKNKKKLGRGVGGRKVNNLPFRGANPDATVSVEPLTPEALVKYMEGVRSGKYQVMGFGDMEGRELDDQAD